MTHKIHHPLEDVFDMEHSQMNEDRYENIDPSSLPAPTQETMEAAVPPDVKDADDIATDKKIDEVYEAAMQTFHNQTAYTEIIEPRYAARNAEVAAQYLGLALNAAVAKGKIKSDRKRANAAFIPFSNQNRTGNMVADRNELLRMIVDTDVKEVK